MIFTTKQTGDKGEAYAAKYLKKHKYKIIARNYKKPYGEIDIMRLKQGKKIPLRNQLTLLIVKSK